MPGEPSSASVIITKILKGAAALTNSPLNRCSVETFPDGLSVAVHKGCSWRARVWTPARWYEEFGQGPEEAWYQLYLLLLTEYRDGTPRRMDSAVLAHEAFGPA